MFVHQKNILSITDKPMAKTYTGTLRTSDNKLKYLDSCYACHRGL